MFTSNVAGYAVEVSYVVGSNWVMTTAGVAPSSGSYLIGDKAYSTSLVAGAGGPVGWVYTAGGCTKFGVTAT